MLNWKWHQIYTVRDLLTLKWHLIPAVFVSCWLKKGKGNKITEFLLYVCQRIGVFVWVWILYCPNVGIWDLYGSDWGIISTWRSNVLWHVFIREIIDMLSGLAKTVTWAISREYGSKIFQTLHDDYLHWTVNTYFSIELWTLPYQCLWHWLSFFDGFLPSRVQTVTIYNILYGLDRIGSGNITVLTIMIYFGEISWLGVTNQISIGATNRTIDTFSTSAKCLVFHWCCLNEIFETHCAQW